MIQGVISSQEAAQRQLEECMEKLNDSLSAVPAELEPDLAQVYESLQLLGSASTDPTQAEAVIAALMSLADAIVDVRQKHATGPLADLPVPPYHLWLPFKAYNVSASDGDRSVLRGPNVNAKITKPCRHVQGSTSPVSSDSDGGAEGSPDELEKKP